MRESRGLSLSRSGTRLSPKALPIGLPRLPYESERGSLDVSEHRLVLRQASEGRRVWRPLLLTWLPDRDRRWLHWRTLTVSENGTRCGPDRAFAARVSWGRDETLLIYRSLTPPVTRSFLGHQTRARLLVGLFSSEGEVEPLLKVD